MSELMGLHRGTWTDVSFLQRFSSIKFVLQHLTLPEKKQHRGSITVVAEEMHSMLGIVHMTVHGQGLDKKDFLGKSDPYLNIYRQHDGGNWVKIHTTEVIKKTLNPSWKPMLLPLQQLCNGDTKRPLKVCVVTDVFL